MENPELAKKLGEWSYMTEKEQEDYRGRPRSSPAAAG